MICNLELDLMARSLKPIVFAVAVVMLVSCSTSSEPGPGEPSSRGGQGGEGCSYDSCAAEVPAGDDRVRVFCSTSGAWYRMSEESNDCPRTRTPEGSPCDKEASCGYTCPSGEWTVHTCDWDREAGTELRRSDGICPILSGEGGAPN